MLFVALLGVSRIEPQPLIQRDSFGVAIVRAATDEDAYYGMGRVLAQDRLWQMEMSRRSARGRLSEILGPSGLRSDKDVLKKAYTDGELQKQFDSLPSEARMAFNAYAAGVNVEIRDREQKGTLPEGYTRYGFKPEDWSVLDSCAIVVSLARIFGTGGAGELRNLALLRYLDTQPVKDKKLDVFDDLAWFNDPKSPTTVADADDKVSPKPQFPNPSRSQTELQLAMMPKTNLLELATAVAEVSFADSREYAQSLAVPFKTGSYAVVVSPDRSATGNPILLGAPQMGHTLPSVIHEIALDGGVSHVAGMDVPGVPGVVIGHNRDAAWTLTSGVADIEDIYVSKLLSATTYEHLKSPTHLVRVPFTIHVKGQPDVIVTQERTAYGPVVLKSGSSNAVFSLRSSIWQTELTMASAILGLTRAKSATDLRDAVKEATTSFNLFYATRSGDIGYQYVGKVPRRSLNTDPRLPSLDDLDFDWNGFIPFSQMPHVENPSSGLLYNWNNKPVSWWNNGDTPVWGAYFRSEELGKALLRRSVGSTNGGDDAKLGVGAVEYGAWSIARHDESGSSFLVRNFLAPLRLSDLLHSTLAPATKQLLSYQGSDLDGSVPTTIASAFQRAMRKRLFGKWIGNLTNDSLFELAVQPSLIAKACRGETKFNYLGDRTLDSVVQTAASDAINTLRSSKGDDPLDWGFKAGAFKVAADLDPVQYDNRGTYMQIIELGQSFNARNVVVPGVAESGPHAVDQVSLSRTWTYKPMWKISSD